MANMGAAANRCRGHNAGANFADLVTEIATPAKGQFVKKMCVTRSNDLVPVDTKRQQDTLNSPDSRPFRQSSTARATSAGVREGDRSALPSQADSIITLIELMSPLSLSCLFP